jgi:hypothetical protein
LLDEAADFFDVGHEPGGGIFFRDGAADVELLNADFSEWSDVGRSDPPGGENDDAIRGLSLERFERGQTFARGPRAARCQDSRDAEIDERFEGERLVGDVVERAVKRDAERMGRGDQQPELLEIETAALIEGAYDDPSGAELFGDFDIAEHDGELVV